MKRKTGATKIVVLAQDLKTVQNLNHLGPLDKVVVQQLQITMKVVMDHDQIHDRKVDLNQAMDHNQARNHLAIQNLDQLHPLDMAQVAMDLDPNNPMLRHLAIMDLDLKDLTLR